MWLTCLLSHRVFADGGSYFQSSEFAKGSVSVNRLRAATMLRPAALEKKMSRIAAR